MRHYIAYNKNEDRGETPEGGSTFRHWTGRSKGLLKKMLGHLTIGKRQRKRIC